MKQRTPRLARRTIRHTVAWPLVIRNARSVLDRALTRNGLTPYYHVGHTAGQVWVETQPAHLEAAVRALETAFDMGGALEEAVTV